MNLFSPGDLVVWKTPELPSFAILKRKFGLGPFFVLRTKRASYPKTAGHTQQIIVRNLPGFISGYYFTRQGSNVNNKTT